MFNLSNVRVVLTLVAMIYDALILVVLYIMNYIMVLIWKLPNISTLDLSSPTGTKVRRQKAPL
jgi:hypothetical protein